MAEPKEFESLDELFRKTFKDLSDTPAQSGWDTPSERVWQHVQTQIKPPQSGWGTQTLTLIAAFAVVLAVGLYLFLSRPAQPETPAAAAPPVVAGTAEQQTAQTSAAETQPAVPEMPVLNTKTLKRKTATAERQTPLNKTEAESAKATQADVKPGIAERPDVKKPVPPNTTERRKAELAKRAEEAWKKALQPLPQRWPGKPDK